MELYSGNQKIKFFIIFSICGPFINVCNGELSKTIASGTHAPRGPLKPGQLIFEENFDKFDLKKWQHEQYLSGGRVREFQWYTNNRSISYTKNGKLHIKPTLWVDDTGEDFLYNGKLNITKGCTNSAFNGCINQGGGRGANILNPIKSARIRTLKSFSFRYGVLEVSAKLPKGDWLWPAIWLMPSENKYGRWPTSGEIDLMESRGNEEYLTEDGRQMGSKSVGSTMHWGPDNSFNKYKLTNYLYSKNTSFSGDFHKYKMIWTPKSISFFVDNYSIGTVYSKPGGFWKMGDLNKSNRKNIWKEGSDMAPFDRKFYIILNLAVGGAGGYFPENAINKKGKKPWKNSSQRPTSEFWEKKSEWLPTWEMDTDKSHFQVDYVRVWAL